MKWKEIKLITLQKTFSADGDNIPNDDSAKDYLAGMPFTANEGLLLICTSKKNIVKKVDLPSTGEKIAGYQRYDMNDLCPDFFQFYGEVYVSDGECHERSQDYVTEANSVILIPEKITGTVTVYYKAYPEQITTETADDYELTSPPDVQALLPLYMASQLYKEDDNAISTSLRNEFEVAYDRLSQGNPMLKMESFESGW